MTKGEGKPDVIDIKGLLVRDEDLVRAAVEAVVQAALDEGLEAFAERRRRVRRLRQSRGPQSGDP